MSPRNRYKLSQVSYHSMGWRSLLAVFFLLGGSTAPWGIQTLSALAATPAGTIITNTATGSFEDPDDLGTQINVTSNEVTVTISEVAGITIATSGITDDGEVNIGDTLYFDFTITNVGNESTLFFVPDAPGSVTNASFNLGSAPIELLEFTDGSGATVDLTTANAEINTPITVSSGGDTTDTLLAGLTGITNGLIPADGTLKIRVPVTVNSGVNNGDLVTVQMGNTTDSGSGTQNQADDADGSNSNEVRTVDPTSGNSTDDPVNGEREASVSQSSSGIVLPPQDFGDAPDSYGTDATDNSGEGIGASHIIISGIHLGTAPDAETDAATPLDGSGDGDDDDGITLPPLLSSNTGYAIPISNISATGTGTLHAWIDFNNNGVFDTTEHQSIDINSGIPEDGLIWTDITVNNTPDSTIYARFRFTSDISIDANTPGGTASDGEVEDYQLTIDTENTNQTIDDTPSSTSCSVQGGTLGDTNIFTPFDNGTMGFEDGSPDQSPVSDPYPSAITGGTYAQYNSDSGNANFRHPIWGHYSYVANMQNARNQYQHEGITDPVYGETGRYFASDPDEQTPTMSVTLSGLTPNQFYEYSFWAANAEPSPPSNNNIDIFIEGESVFSTGELPDVQAALAWKKYMFTFTNGPNTEITIDLASTKTGNGGNDFYLDNIELRDCNFAIDFGDAPSSYGDALHTTIPTTPTVYLGGISPDSETETPLGGDGGVGADGDDTVGDDEDGYASLPDIPESGTYTLSNIPVYNDSGSNATLHAWIDFNQDGKFAAEEYQSTSVNTGGSSLANLSWTIPDSTSSGTTYARFRITQNELIEDDLGTTDVDERSKDAVINGEVEDYPVVLTAPAVTNPNVILVKRITAINGQTTNPNDGTDLTQFVDDTSSSYQTQDNESGWPTNYLVGEINAGLIKPGDTIEYTIYFLSSGDDAAEDVRICDRIQEGQTFQLGSYDSGNADLQLQLGSDPVMNLTASNDSGDRAEFVSNGTSPTNCNLLGSNDNGVLVLDITGTGNTNQTDLTDLPQSTGTGAPNNSYGFIKFQTTID